MTSYRVLLTEEAADDWEELGALGGEVLPGTAATGSEASGTSD